MKLTIKAIIVTAITTISSLAAVVYSSCNADKCKSVVCAHGGICNKGACTCPTGYVGTSCETENRKRFTGNWNVFEKGSTSLAKQYQVSVKDGESITFVNITNFYNFFHTPIKAYVEGDRIIIPAQRLEGKVVYGEGQLSSPVTYNQYGGITMKYLVQDTATLIKDDFGYEAPLDFSDASAWNK